MHEPLAAPDSKKIDKKKIPKAAPAAKKVDQDLNEELKKDPSIKAEEEAKKKKVEEALKEIKEVIN